MMNATLSTSEEIAEAPAPPLSESLAPPPPARLVSLDAFRGLAMVLMVSAGLSMHEVAKSYPASPTWKLLGFHTEHAAWTGCTLWDLIQPCFMFMVGAAVPFSIASRVAKGQRFARMFVHALWRAVALTLLGVFLSTSSSNRLTNWEFANVLSQIGLGYLFLFLLGWVRPRWQLVAAFSILFVYWLAFALYPAPQAGYDFALVNGADIKPHLDGFGAHWDKNSNFGAAVDRWFLNLFPQQPARRPYLAFVPGLSAAVAYWFPTEPFLGNKGGYLTLNFIPSLATMIFGLLAGGLLRSPASTGRKLLVLVLAGGIGLGAGYLLDYANICPLVKRIWTPSWALFSAGYAFLGLAFFYLVLDVVRFRIWALPLVIVGMNSIAIYIMSQLLKPFIRDSIKKHLGENIFTKAGEQFGGAHFAPLVQSATILIVLWLVTLWMYRRRLFLKI
jgi:predicted acyltransferase